MKKTFQNASLVMSIVSLLFAATRAQAGCGDFMRPSGLRVVVPSVGALIGPNAPAGDSNSAGDLSPSTDSNDSIIGLWHVAYVTSDG